MWLHGQLSLGCLNLRCHPLLGKCPHRCVVVVVIMAVPFVSHFHGYAIKYIHNSLALELNPPTRVTIVTKDTEYMSQVIIIIET